MHFVCNRFYVSYLEQIGEVMTDVPIYPSMEDLYRRIDEVENICLDLEQTVLNFIAVVHKSREDIVYIDSKIVEINEILKRNNTVLIL